MSRYRLLARAAIRVVAVIGAVLLAGAVLQAYVENEQRLRFPPPGELVEVGGDRRLHMRTWGEGKGPTILLDISAATPSSAWTWIARDLAADYRVVAYDRPGMAWSAGWPGERDARSAADALGAALEVAGIDPPYIVVGHSYGGFSARVFAGLHRDDVLALVLLDTTHPSGTGAGFAAWYRWRALVGHTGLNQLFPPANGFGGLPDAEAEAAHAVSLWTSHLDATAEELEAWAASAEQVRGAGDFDDLPVLVVSAAGIAAHADLQRQIASISSRSRFVELNVGHSTMLTDPHQAEQVTAEIRRFLAELDDPP